MSDNDYIPYFTEGDYFHSVGTSGHLPRSSRVLGENEKVTFISGWRADRLYESHKSWIIALKSAHDLSSIKCSSKGCKAPASEGCHLDFNTKSNTLFLEDADVNIEVESDDPDVVQWAIMIVVPICSPCHHPSRTSNENLPISLKPNTPCILDTGFDDLLSAWYFNCEKCEHRLEREDGNKEGIECDKCGHLHEEDTSI